ncbi:hypothetical protein J2P12_00150 [Candidatus Bathyarchaeota archaeon]|nr:hypothetical protein [Candidatus Bathyarchaeota archaeon]
MLIWALYYCGVFIHLLLSAYASIASEGNSVKTVRAWWDYNFHLLGWRLLLDGAFLFGWESAPATLVPVIGHLVPVAYGTAPMMGIAIDRMLSSGTFALGWLKVDMTQVAPMSSSAPPR